jgi:hypothetical protein
MALLHTCRQNLRRDPNVHLRRSWGGGTLLDGTPLHLLLDPPTPMSSSPAPASAASRIELAPAMRGADQQRLRSDWLKPTR